MKPRIGQIVIYKTTEEDRETLKQCYKDNPSVGCNISIELPAIIVAVRGDTCVNLKVICDGPIDLWITSKLQGDSEGNWKIE